MNILEVKQHKLSENEIVKLVTGEIDQIFIPESDYGLFEIYFRNGLFEVFEIPMYGGEPVLYEKYNSLKDVIETVHNWC